MTSKFRTVASLLKIEIFQAKQNWTTSQTTKNKNEKKIIKSTCESAWIKKKNLKFCKFSTNSFVDTNAMNNWEEMQRQRKKAPGG